MKATLIYWDRSFVPEQANHRIKSMIKSIENKVKNGEDFKCLRYFYEDKRYQSVARYPAKGKGVSLPGTFLEDLDKTFCSLIKLVPFQFNSDLIHALSGKNKKELTILRRKNCKIRVLRNFLKVRLQK